MSEFKRSPSKVWWANESIEWREISASPGSQDSGFSDTETSPPDHLKQQLNGDTTPRKATPAQRIPKAIFKELSSDEKPQNLSINFKEKSTTKNCIKSQLAGEKLSWSDFKPVSTTTTPKRDVELHANSEPSRKHRFTKNSPKVSRNLFNTNKPKDTARNVTDNQYSKDVLQEITHSSTAEETYNDGLSWRSTESYEIYDNQSLPCFQQNNRHLSPTNRSAPAILELEKIREFRDDEAVTSFNNSLSSDCESELECLFNGPLDSPKHTSTPKTAPPTRAAMRLRRGGEKLPPSFYHERVPPIHTVGEDAPDNAAVRKWMDEARQTNEPECMTTLQCKSIASELNQKVSQLATQTTITLRGILSHSRCIEMEYRNLNSEKKHVGPLVQSLTGNINDFIKTHVHHQEAASQKIDKLNDQIRSATSPDEALQLAAQLFAAWESIQQEILTKELNKLVDNLENPTTELALRATVTAITSVSLRNEELIEMFTKADVIPNLLALCEKCEGSTLRSQLLRALSTMCGNAFAVRQFEKFNGVQIISDTIEEDSRPEPERSEAIALLAQVTAPWLEDNHCVKGLQDYSRQLVKALTKFIGATKCCQNLLLGTAALANLSTMDGKCIKYMLNINTVTVVLEAVRNRGPRASVYLLEQVATLIANMSAVELARKQLTAANAPVALLRFLHVNHSGEDVGKRLQQKSIIALSRLCGDREAALQLVDLGGVDKLVKMCREKSERYDNDAVLVAALATLRKIADTCGSDVINAQDAQELVEPKLLDSFLAYSSQNESYV